jgi:hypothetical protein
MSNFDQHLLSHGASLIINRRKVIPCRIEPLFLLQRLPSLASHVFRLMPWHIEADTAAAAFITAAPITAHIVEAMRTVASPWALVLLPSAQQS